MKDPDRIYKRILRLIMVRRCMTQKALSEELCVSSAAICRALGRLETAGLVKRNAPQSERDSKRQVESFCLGISPMLVIVRLSKDRRCFEYVSMNFDGGDRRVERLLFRAELSFDDNCKAIINEVALKLKLLKTGGKLFFLGVIDDETRHAFWRSVGADIVTSEHGMAHLLCEARGGAACYIETISADNAVLSVMLDGKVVCSPKEKDKSDVRSVAYLASVMGIENVFAFAPSELEVLTEECLHNCFSSLGRQINVINCSASEQEKLLYALLAEKVTDILI